MQGQNHIKHGSETSFSMLGAEFLTQLSNIRPLMMDSAKKSIWIISWGN